MIYELWELSHNGGFMICSSQERQHETKLKMQHCISLDAAFEAIRKHRDEQKAKVAA